VVFLGDLVSGIHVRKRRGVWTEIPTFLQALALGGSMLLIMNTTSNAYGAKTDMLQLYVGLDEDFQKYHGYVNNDLFLMINWGY